MYVARYRGQLLNRFMTHNTCSIDRDEWEARLFASFCSQQDRLRRIALDYRQAGIYVWEPSERFFQTKLFNASAPPPFFYVRSERHDHAPLAGASIAVVGSRQPSAYGVRATKHIVRKLAERGVLIISGGAAGIDGVAHQTALESGALTVAVLAHGVDHVYPAKHKDLFETIKKRGWLLSEYPPGVTPKRHYFPARNRLVAALADAVIVTSAKAKSGTLITASYAADQGKPVFSVPGSIFDQEAESCHLLIKEGANLITDIDDLSTVFPDWSF